MRKLSISELCMKLVTLIFIRPHIKPFGECRTHAASGQYADNVITINIFYEIFYRRPVTSTFTLVKKKNLSSAHSYEKLRCKCTAYITWWSPKWNRNFSKKSCNLFHWNRRELFHRLINKNRMWNKIIIGNFTWTNAHTTSSCSMCRMDCDYIFSILPRNSNTINT